MMPWRTYQRVRTIGVHLRDLGALILAAGSVAMMIYLVG